MEEAMGDELNLPKDSQLKEEEEEAAVIGLTAEALTQALALQVEKPEWQGLPLRLYLEGKGCDGFFYGVSFDPATAADHHFPQGEHGELTVIVDPDSLDFVAGSLITWVDDERGRGFLVENPDHKKFRGKFFKRSTWQEKLKQKLASQQGSCES